MCGYTIPREQRGSQNLPIAKSGQRGKKNEAPTGLEAVAACTVTSTFSHEECGGEGTLWVEVGVLGEVTSGCSLYGFSLARITELIPVTAVGIMAWWGWGGEACDTMRWDG